MRHCEERLQLGERTLVDAVDEALQRAEQAAVGNEQNGKHRRERRRQHAFLHAQLVGEVRLVVDLKLAGNSGADLGAFDLGRVADADGVDRFAGAVAEGDDVAVGREALADAVRQRQSHWPASAAGFRWCPACRHRARPSRRAAPCRATALPLRIKAPNVHLPVAVGRLGEVAHAGVGDRARRHGARHPGR